MSAFLVLYHSGKKASSRVGKMIDESEFSNWEREISNAVLDGGCTEDGLCITLDKVKPLSEGSTVTNYLILEARDKDEAVELSRGAPSLGDGGTAEVFELSMAG